MEEGNETKKCPFRRSRDLKFHSISLIRKDINDEELL
jgi:hypothetical protein